MRGILLVTVTLSCTFAASFASGQAPANARRVALLVGIENYPNLEKHEQLHGCRNDVALMKRVLLERFGFQEGDILTLVDAEATGDAIRKAFDEVHRRVAGNPADAPPAQVIFHFSGHGSQVPDELSGEDADETDGYDETLVPADATKQGGKEDIRDDEVHRFAERISSGGRAKLWVVLDCCHSGTGVRGTTSFRSLDRTLVLSPKATDANRRINEKTIPSGVTALYACRSLEKEPEFEMAGEKYGLLTWFVSQVVNDTPVLSDFTYQQLSDAVISRYRRDRNTPQPSPSPRVEGEERAVVLSAGKASDRPPYWKVLVEGNDRANVLVSAGAVHGVTVGSLFEVYERPEQIDQKDAQSIAWLRIDKVEFTTSKASVLERTGDEYVPFRLPRTFADGYGAERFRHHGGFGTAVRVVRAVDQHSDGPPLESSDPAIPRAIREAFEKANRPTETPWLKWAGAKDEFSLLLRIDGEQAALFPKGGASYVDPSTIAQRGKTSASLRGGWGPYSLDKVEETAARLQEDIRKITRARNLIRLVEEQRAGGSGQLRVKLELQEIDVDLDAGNIKAWKPWPLTKSTEFATRGSSAAQGSRVVQEGAYYDWKIQNDGADRVYVTVLQIDANMGIQVMLPVQRGDLSPTLEGTAALTLNGFQLTGDDDQPPVLGSRWTIVLATKEPNHFSMLAQNSLPAVRGDESPRMAPTGTRAANAEPSSLEQILLKETYFQTRGGDKPLFGKRTLHDSSWSVDMVEWLTVPAKKP